MKRMFFGLMAGVLLCGAASFIFIPRIEQKSYTSGYDAGNRNGITTGTATGIQEGIAKEHATEQAQREQASQAAEQRHEEAVAQAKRHAKHVEKPIQNWHVIDNKIADPIPDEPASAAKAADTAPTNG